jgi:hypothetical protein
LLLERYLGLLAHSEDPKILKEAREFLRDNDITVRSIGEEVPNALTDAIVLDDEYMINYSKEYKNG